MKWTAWSVKRPGLAVIASVTLAVLFVAMIPTVSAATAAPSTSTITTRVATSASTDQWAFGGSVSSVYSCTTTDCPGGNLTSNQTLSMNWTIDLNWAVIYSQTNVSASQTEFEVQTALGVSLSFGYSACVTTTSCAVESGYVSVGGHESATGFTNVTSGYVNLTAGTGSPATVPAWAVKNASSNGAFNLSGSLSEHASGESVSGNFDVGGSESSSIAFAAPLGIVPVSPTPGDEWNASQPYTASGSYISGISAAATVNGTSKSISDWTPGTLAKTGTLNVSGNDTGTTTLEDNYTSPPTSITAQDITLNFSAGNFTGSDGWLLASTAWYDTLFSGLGSVSLAVAQAPALTADTSVAAASTGLGSSESTYFTAAAGFIGASIAGSTSDLTSSLPGGPSIDLKAGPEPVSVAEQQYASITAGAGSSGFPLALVLIGVVVAAVAVVAIVLVARSRSARRPPSTTATPPPASGPSPPLTGPGAP